MSEKKLGVNRKRAEHRTSCKYRESGRSGTLDDQNLTRRLGSCRFHIRFVWDARFHRYFWSFPSAINARPPI